MSHLDIVKKKQSHQVVPLETAASFTPPKPAQNALLGRLNSGHQLFLAGWWSRMEAHQEQEPSRSMCILTYEVIDCTQLKKTTFVVTLHIKKKNAK